VKRNLFDSMKKRAISLTIGIFFIVLLVGNVSAAQYEFDWKMLKDNNGVPGEIISDYTVNVGESFFINITARDTRGASAQGLRSMGIHIGWNPKYLEYADSDINNNSYIAGYKNGTFNCDVMTCNFPMYRSGKLNITQGVIYNLGGGSSKFFKAGRPVSLKGEPEHLSLLRFNALRAVDNTIIVIQASGSVGCIPSRLGCGYPSTVRFISHTITIKNNNNCQGADINSNGQVDIGDLQKFISDMKSNCKNIKSLYVLWILNELDKTNGLRNCNSGNKLCNMLDINSNGNLNSLDALLLLNALDSCSSGNPGMNTASDLNDDGFVDTIDRNLLLGKLNQFPVGRSC